MEEEVENCRVVKGGGIRKQNLTLYKFILKQSDLPVAAASFQKAKSYSYQAGKLIPSNFGYEFRRNGGMSRTAIKALSEEGEQQKGPNLKTCCSHGQP